SLRWSPAATRIASYRAGPALSASLKTFFPGRGCLPRRLNCAFRVSSHLLNAKKTRLLLPRPWNQSFPFSPALSLGLPGHVSQTRGAPAKADSLDDDGGNE